MTSISRASATPAAAGGHRIAGPDGSPSVRLRARLARLFVTIGERPRLLLAVAAATFLMAAAGALFAQQAGRPITSAIIFLLGVKMVGALEGVWGGLLGALAASALYNFFIAEPTFRFSFDSIEHYFPLIAFNASAAASGILTGRLKDRARAAELANRRIEALLAFSRQLQGAVSLDDVAAAIDGYLSERDGPRLELYVAGDQGLEPVHAAAGPSALAERLVEARQTRLTDKGEAAFLLSGAESPVGVLLARSEGGRIEAEDLAALANLVSITIERLLLLGKLADAELVRRSEEFKTILLSSISHDMRTPLSAISASASSLAQYGSELPEEARADMLSMIQEQCQRLNRYTTNLLNLGRLQAGVDRQRFTRIDALEALGTAILHARELSGAHPIEKKLAPSEAIVTADPVMLEQVFHNVLENAARYSDPGSPITVHAVERHGRLLVSIRDVGPGIPAGEFDRIFDRFYRGGQAHAPEGTGLGLAIAKGFTESFGGRIWAGLPGDEKGGTIVTIELPLARSGDGR